MDSSGLSESRRAPGHTDALAFSRTGDRGDAASFFSRLVACVLVTASLLLGNTQAHVMSELGPLSPWAIMSGCWVGEGEESNTAGEIFRQNGRMRITVTEDTLHVEKSFEVITATGLYAPLLSGGQRELHETWTFDVGANMVAIQEHGSPAPPRLAALSSDGRVFRTFLFHHSQRAMTLFGIERIHPVDGEIRIDTDIRDAFGPYREVYREVWRRASAEPNECDPLSAS